MAELDPRIILQAGNALQNTPTYGDVMEQRARVQARQQALAEHNADRAQAEQSAALQKQVLRQYGTDPSGARKTAMEGGDPGIVDKLDQMDDAQRKRTFDISQRTAPILAGLKRLPLEQRAAGLQRVSPLLQQAGFTPEHVQELAQAGLSDEWIDSQVGAAMTIKDWTEANKPQWRGPGTALMGPNGEMIAQVPFAPRTYTDDDGNIIEYTPQGAGRSGAPSGGAPGVSGPMTVDGVRPHIVAQESHGNYAARNRETGAMGAYQVMPETGRALAERLGLPWRPQLMTGTTGEAKAYQDAIGGAAIQEAIEASDGDPNTMAQYYHGGSNREGWGPKTQQYGREVTARLGGGAAPAGGRIVGKTTPKGDDAPSGYRWNAGHTGLEPIPGGPAENKGTATDNKGEMALRKEFDALQTVKDFRAMRQSWGMIDSIGKKGANATAQDDMAMIFLYMKMLDPGSVVREGEFASAQNAAGVPDRIRNSYNAAISGNKLNPEQRKNMINSAATVYLPIRDQYNETARQYQGYAREAGFSADRVAQEFKPTRQQGQGGNIPTLSPEQAQNLPKGARFKGIDGVVRVKH